MSESIRRSSRRSKKPTFSVGNLVEIVSKDDSDNVISKGRLISKLTDDPVDGLHWLVEVDGGLQPKEDMDESRFGEILGKIDGPITAISNRHPNLSLKSSASSAASTKESKDENSTKELNGSTGASELDHSRPSSSHGNTKTLKSKIIRLSDPRASASSSNASLSPSDQKNSLVLAPHEQRGERRLNHPLRDLPRPLKKQKVPKQKEDVVRIPMKTGVLLLYKGIHRRAEFVRKV